MRSHTSYGYIRRGGRRLNNNIGKELYQKVYDELAWYGDANQAHCPGVRFIPLYEHHLMSPIMDLGCGRGHTVYKLREKFFNADGVDFIHIPGNGMVTADITEPLDLSNYNTSICIDVFEHLTDEQCRKVLENMKQTKRQVITVTNAGSTHFGVELHINRKSFFLWEDLINEYVHIVSKTQIKEYTMMFLCEHRV